MPVKSKKINLQFPKGNVIDELLAFASQIINADAEQVEIQGGDMDFDHLITYCAEAFQIPHQWLRRGNVRINLSEDVRHRLEKPKSFLLRWLGQDSRTGDQNPAGKYNHLREHLEAKASQ